MLSSVNVTISSKRSNDAAPASASLAAARSKRKIVHEAVTTNADSTAAATDADLNLCRYKTGRCTNARVIKPSGVLLLLCEFHRSQQNRTKKRSDMKYRQDRAKKRMVGRQQVTDSPQALPTPGTTAGDVDAHKSKEKKSARAHRNHRSDKLKAFADLFQKSDCAFSLMSPHKERGDSLFFASSSSFSNSSRFELKGDCLSSRGTIHSSVLDLDDADIMINSLTVRALGDVDARSSLFPFCVSPLSSTRQCGEPLWQPDDVRLLEYFIL